MIIVILEGRGGAGGKFHFCEFLLLIVGVLNSLALQIFDRGNIAVVVIAVGVAKLFLIQLDSIKQNVVDVMVIHQIHSDFCVCFRCNHGASCILPVHGTVRIRVKGKIKDVSFSVLIGKYTTNTEGTLCLRQRCRIALGPSGKHEGVTSIAAYCNILIDIQFTLRIALQLVSIIIELRCLGQLRGNHPLIVATCIGR